MMSQSADARKTSLYHELRALHAQLQDIGQNMASYEPRIPKLPILDSAVECEAKPRSQEGIPGLRILREEIKRDLDVLGKFLEGTQTSSGPAFSTNAPYLIAVWREVLAAPPSISSIYRTFFVSHGGKSSTSRRAKAQKVPGTKVDVVADNGRRWIRVNTIKNSRILAEFREIDSYFTSSEDDSDVSMENRRPSLAQKEFDNSVLRMGRALLAAARDNPVPGSSDAPQVTLRLTRLDPSEVNEFGEENDTRIARTIAALRDMGLDVELGERDDVQIPALPSPEHIFTTTTCINLDLSALIALVSDITQSPLPKSIEEVNARFIPSSQYLEWKKQRMQHLSSKNSSAADNEETWEDSGQHSRALANQVMQEIRQGLLQETFDRLSSLCPTPALEGAEFWTTPEARDRCLRIISKIGGPRERQRAHALFSDSQRQYPPLFWEHSRYPSEFLPLLPVHVFPSSEPDDDSLKSFNNISLPPFFTVLASTCREVLSQDVAMHPRAISTEIDHDGQEMQRAAVTKANPKLTAHTVQSLLWGASLGWTTLTANRSSVKAILKELKTSAPLSSLHDQDSSNGLETGKEKAAIWIVDPRSLAEGMRSDYNY